MKSSQEPFSTIELNRLERGLRDALRVDAKTVRVELTDFERLLESVKAEKQSIERGYRHE